VGLGEPVPPQAAVRPLPDGSPVWLGRQAPGLALDEIVLERLAIAAAILLDHPSAPSTGLGDAALVELALSATAGEAERSRALHLLGMRPQGRLTVLATTQPLQVGRVAELGALHAVLVPGPVPELGLAPDIQVGVAEVAVLDEFDEDTIEVLVAYRTTDSVRKAAAAVYRHHSTVAARLATAEVRLGFALSTTDGRRRLDLALMLRHLRNTAQR
jgi:hypothetical protein